MFIIIICSLPMYKVCTIMWRLVFLYEELVTAIRDDPRRLADPTPRYLTSVGLHPL